MELAASRCELRRGSQSACLQVGRHFTEPFRAQTTDETTHEKSQAIMKNIRIKGFIILLVASILVGVTGLGCKHTANGAGQDIQHMGEKIQEKTQ
jgi:predicted small secreted protein